MSLRIRRGTDAERSGTTFASGEPVWTTNNQQLWVGDGITQGGVNIAKNLAGTGLAFGTNPQDAGTYNKLYFAGASYTTDDIAEGTGADRKYFSDERAQDAVAAALLAGVHTNISFVYQTTQDNANRIDATVALDGIGITSVNQDPAPSLGGTLLLNSHNINGTGNIDITGSVKASLGLGGNLSLNSYDITGTGNVAITGTVSATGLGANLSLNTHDITGTGNVSITGDIMSSTISGKPNLEWPTGMIYTGTDFTFGSADGSRNGRFFVVSNSSGLIDPIAEFRVHNDTVNGSTIAFVRSRGDQLNQTTLLDGDVIANLGFVGVGTTDPNFGVAIQITGEVAGTTSAGVVPGRLILKTADAFGTMQDSVQIEPTGLLKTNYGLSVGASEDLANAGAASLTKVTSRFATEGAETATLAAGIEGQVKHLVAEDVTAGNMVVTVSSPGWTGSGTITFATKGAACQLQYINSKWFCIGNNGATFG